MAFAKRKRGYPWLTGGDGGAYCNPCKKFYEGKHGKAQLSSGGLFVSQPFTNWKKSTGSNPKDNKLLKHQSSTAHKISLGISIQSDKLRNSGAGSVLSLLKNHSDEQKRDNFLVLKNFARVLYFLVYYELPHTTCSTPLLHLMQDCDYSGKIRQ